MAAIVADGGDDIARVDRVTDGLAQVLVVAVETHIAVAMVEDE